MIKASITLIIIILIVVFILIARKICVYWYEPIEIELTEVARLNTDKELPGTLWVTAYSKDNNVEKQYNIKLPEIDYNKNCLFISLGREIKKLTYTRVSKYQTPYKNVYIGREVFRGQHEPHTIFVYKINNIKLIDEETAGFKPEIRIED